MAADVRVEGADGQGGATRLSESLLRRIREARRLERRQQRSNDSRSTAEVGEIAVHLREQAGGHDPRGDRSRPGAA